MATKKKAKKATKKTPARRAAPKRPAKKKRVAARKPVAKKKLARKAAPVRRAAKPRKAAKAAAPKKARAKALARREDRAGHMDPRYAAELRSRMRSERPPADPAGFIPGPRAKDDLVEGLGEEFVTTATSGEYESEDVQNQYVSEERGGPFVETTANQEFARGTDASNPKGSTREPFPRT